MNRKSVSRPIGVWLSVALVGLAPLYAADIYVSKQGQDPPVGDGSQQNPFLKIVDAVLAANDGDRILVGPGTYQECVFASEFTIPGTDQDKPLTLIAQDWIDNQNNATTIIDGTTQCGPAQIAPDATVVIGSSNSRLEGFTITGGGGAGVQAFGNTVVTNNVIQGNVSLLGGGVFFEAATCYFGETLGAEISNNTIRNNTAQYSGSDQIGGDGGGIYINANPVVDDPLSPCEEFGDFRITIAGNTIQDNELQSPAGRAAFGGGIFAVTNAGVVGQPNGQAIQIGSAEVRITQNVIQNNGHDVGAVGYGGGLFVSTYGFGEEYVLVEDNDIRLNTSRAGADVSGDGGGMSAWVQMINSTRTGMSHKLIVRDNDIINNTSQGNGGGIDMFAFLDDVSYSSNGIDPAFTSQQVEYRVENNRITGNSAQGNEGGGGGILASLFARRTQLDPGNLIFELNGNQLRDNTAAVSGGGLSLWIRADAEPPSDPITSPAAAEIVAERNLIASNDVTGAGGVGGGIFANIEAYSQGIASVVIDRATIADNTRPAGSGGIEIEGRTDFDQGGVDEGFGQISILNSIVSENQGSGIGGAQFGLEDGKLSPASNNSGNVTIDVFNTDVFGHPLANYEAWVGDRTGLAGAGNLSVDPLLSNDNLYVPAECSPTIDAADTLVDFSLEPQPNGGRANLGHLGGTALAPTALADLTGDSRVDGNEIVKIAASFGASLAGAQPWYDASVDVDGDNDVDGDDLAIVSADFAKVCP